MSDTKPDTEAKPVRNYRLQVLLSPEELRYIRIAAATAGTDMSSYVRAKILRQS